MEEMKNSDLEQCQEPEPNDSPSAVANRGGNEIDLLFEADVRSRDAQPNHSAGLSGALAKQLSSQLEGILKELGSCREELSRLSIQTEELKAADQIVADLSNRYRELSEQFYEREVLGLVIHRLIRLADGCRHQLGRLQNTRAKHADSNNESAVKALALLIGTQEANLVEFEDALADLGVESFRHHEDAFEASLQKCINRVECKDTALTDRIAERLLPGYRRHEKVVRKEYVSVYVLKNKKEDTENGGI
jgi:molecular chaperone GrpE (heat shock protein)